MSVLRALSRTKLYWGLLIICLIGALASPHTSSGRNIFLSYGNLTDVLRQVSITGLVATGMTLVILLGGIDLSVGSMMGFSTIICAMLLTKAGWTAASLMGVPAAALVSFLAVAFLARFIFNGLARGRDMSAGKRREIRLDPWRSLRIPALLGLAAAVGVAWFASVQVATKFGVLIFGLLSDILQFQNIDSNVQLVTKGLIIVCTVLVQEQNLGQLLTRRRSHALSPATSQPGSVDLSRPRSSAKAPIARENLNEAS